ncbi:hypothetical protein GcC1_119027 [Golovinomyces cichoracearum]|uniref:Uncharacterized protein n=1 Tax=Golovinomyces cichoracearum TaxID=62708 RepID=A0A420I792_9PEZI|nr:hypothetical protein GcC1_119027 [Golovinomyces cichoracearum]
MDSDGSNAQSSIRPITEPYAWNTKNLLARIGADLTASCSAAACVAPLVTAIMQNASGQATLFSSLATSCSTFLRRPHIIVFSRPFFLNHVTIRRHVSGCEYSTYLECDYNKSTRLMYN